MRCLCKIITHILHRVWHAVQTNTMQNDVMQSWFVGVVRAKIFW